MSNKFDEAAEVKAVFMALWVLVTIIVAIIMHFVIMYKGWGLTVQSWGWLISLWLCATCVTVTQNKIVNFIKKDL